MVKTEKNFLPSLFFNKNKYVVIKQAISNDLATFCYNYFLMKKQVYDTCLEEEKAMGHFKHKAFKTSLLGLGHYESKNEQIPNTYSCYADIVMETLLLKCQPLMEKHTGLKLLPTYSYARIYKNGDILQRHKDRQSCEVSTTMFLGGDFWPIFLSPYENVGIHDGPNAKPGITFSSGAKGVKVDLKHGDMLVYDGLRLEHWREKFKGKICGQVFLHYNNKKTKGSEQNFFDQRPHLGLPLRFKKVI